MIGIKDQKGEKKKEGVIVFKHSILNH